MPFVKESFYIQEPIAAFVMLMRRYGITQAEAQRIIDRGRILVEGERLADKAVKISGNTEVVIFKSASRGRAPFFLTPDFMVFDKPSGVLVHPKKMSTPYSMLDEVRHYGGEKANAVHRIDMETSGLLLASRHKDSERFLKGAFEKRDISKSYRAWATGRIEGEFCVDAAISINDDYTPTKHKVFIDEDGKSAKTLFTPLLYDSKYDATLLECLPLTGRTHQIRIHLFHVKHPILGDPIYGTDYETAEAYLEGRLSEEEGYRKTGASRLMLHAYSLDFDYKNRYRIVSRNSFKKIGESVAIAEKRDFGHHDGWKKDLSPQERYYRKRNA